MNNLNIRNSRFEIFLLSIIYTDRNESTQIQEGVNCVAKFSQFSGNRLRPCSDRLFITRPENGNAAEISRTESEHRILRGNTSIPTEVKNHDLPL